MCEPDGQERTLGSPRLVAGVLLGRQQGERGDCQTLGALAMSVTSATFSRAVRLGIRL